MFALIHIKKTLSVLFVTFLCLSCSTATYVRDERISPEWTHEGSRPKTVAVLPFENATTEKDLEILVRESFYSHFSALNFYDIELSRVDNTLKMIEQNEKVNWRTLPPSVLGERLPADLIVYGKVKNFNKYFLGIYSQIALEVEVEIVDCASGEGRWRKTLIKRSHDGGLPFDLFGLAPAAVRSGLHMTKEKVVALVDLLNRSMVEDMPDPPPPPVAAVRIVIQAASFLDRERAEKTLRQFEGLGLKPKITEVTLGSDLWHRVMLGPFYSVSESEEVRKRITENTKFKPIVIRRYTESKNRQEPGN